MIRYIWFDWALRWSEAIMPPSIKRCWQIWEVKKEIKRSRECASSANKYFMREHPGCLGKKGRCPRLSVEKPMEYLQLGRENAAVSRIGMEQENPSLFAGENSLYGRCLNAALHQRGIKTGLISNWDHSCRRVLEEAWPVKPMDTVEVSSEAGCGLAAGYLRELFCWREWNLRNAFM